jgi:hypothetical protein
MRYIQRPKEKSTTPKVCQSEHFHQYEAISRVIKVLTNNSNPTSDPDQYECLQQLFPPPNETYVSYNSDDHQWSQWTINFYEHR